ncbi:hypothetical protein LINPERHAP2_LOCUS12993 [Linum perenne]
MAKSSSDATREYKSWTKLEEQTLIMCMREMTDNKLVTNGNFNLPHLKALEKMMHDKLENCELLAVPHMKSKSHPKASRLNNKPLLCYDDLSVIFGVQQATGVHAVHPSDVASKIIHRSGMTNYMEEDTVEHVDSYTIPANMDHNAVMEDLINQGIDMDATGLKEVEAETTSKRATAKGKEVDPSSGSKRSRQQFTNEDRAQIASAMSAASENFGKTAVSYCIEGNVAVRRQYLYAELANFPELTGNQRTRVMRHLNRDDGDATTFFQLPTDKEKLEFIWWILE